MTAKTTSTIAEIKKILKTAPFGLENGFDEYNNHDDNYDKDQQADEHGTP